MGDQFNWRLEEAGDPRDRAKDQQRTRASSTSFWIMAAIITLSVIGGWAVYQWRVEKGEADLIKQIQEILDLQQQAVASGDGDLFFALQYDDPRWRAAQLLPLNQAINRAGLTVTNVEEAGEYLWINATWEDEGELLQRILFFESVSCVF